MMATFSLLFGLFFMLVIQGCPMETTSPTTTVTDVEAVSNAKSALEIGFGSGDSVSNVTANIELVTTGQNGVTITWMSDNESVISTMGQVTRPTTGGNVIVTLTATLTKGSASDTKTFMVTVITMDSTPSTVTSGAGRVYADADAVSDVGMVTIGNIDKNSAGGVDAIVLNFTNNSGEGANGSDNYLIVSESGADAAGAWGVLVFPFQSDFDMLETNTSLSFYVRSSDTDVTNIALKVEGPAGTGSSEVSKTFTADGNWQKVAWHSSELTGGADLAALANIVIVLNPALGGTSDKVEIGIDEIQFVITNIDSPPPGVTMGASGIYADAASTGDLPSVTVSGIAGFSEGDSKHSLTETTTGSAGAEGSTMYQTLAITDASSTYGGMAITLTESFNATAVIGTVLKFNIKTTDATNGSGMGVIKFKLEKTDGAGAEDTNPRTFTADGAWQEISIPMMPDIFGGDHSAWISDIKKIVLVLEDVNGSTTGIGAQTIDVDEFRFDTNGDSSRMLMEAKIYADGASTSFDQIVLSATKDAPGVFGEFDGTGFKEITNGSDGADGSTRYWEVSNVNSNANWSGFQYFLEDHQDFKDTELKFSVRSPIGGISNIGVDLQREGGPNTPTGMKNFVADGTWQEVVFPMVSSTFLETGNYDVTLTNFNNIVIRLIHNNPFFNAKTEYKIDIDEIRFEVDGGG